jgi:hypothetical protein
MEPTTAELREALTQWLKNHESPFTMSDEWIDQIVNETYPEEETNA